MVSLRSLPADDLLWLERDNGTSAVLHLHGGTLLSWKCKGQENLFLSSTAVFNNTKAIRGGVPIVFPNFGPWKFGPQHGFARIKRWNTENAPKKLENGDVLASISLEDDKETQAMWNYKFKLVYTLQLSKDSLSFTFAVHNSGKDTFDFTCLLHTYLRVADIRTTYIVGLQGLTYVDKVKDDAKIIEKRDKVEVDQLYDRIYVNTPDTVLITSGPEPARNIQMTASNFTDIVVWNPWMDNSKAMTDFDDFGYKEMICVEVGKLSVPTVLAAGQTFQCSQVLKSLL